MNEMTVSFFTVTRILNTIVRNILTLKNELKNEKILNNIRIEHFWSLTGLRKVALLGVIKINGNQFTGTNWKVKWCVVAVIKTGVRICIFTRINKCDLAASYQ